MPFDVKKFQKAKFTPTIEEIPVPELQDFFDDGEKAVWKVRGLTGQEMGRANETAERNKNIAAIIDGLVSGEQREKTEAIKNLLGINQYNVPDDIAKRIAYLQFGSVDPVCTEDMAVKLCTVKGVEFYILTNAIIRLTGVGQTLGKSKPSGETLVSKPASHLDTETKDSSMK